MNLPRNIMPIYSIGPMPRHTKANFHPKTKAITKPTPIMEQPLINMPYFSDMAVLIAVISAFILVGNSSGLLASNHLLS